MPPKAMKKSKAAKAAKGKAAAKGKKNAVAEAVKAAKAKARASIAASKKKAGEKRKAKRKATPEYKRLLDRSHRLWETYDAKPLKKNLVAFGTHVERMEKSSSLKVKTEARRAARAFNAEFRARGWKK